MQPHHTIAIIFSRCAILLSISLFGAGALAQGYPARPLKLIVPFAPGGSTDVVARVISVRLSAELGQPVITENRGGASGMVGAEAASKAAPDGYTLFLGASSVLAINSITFAKLPYDPVKSFAPVSMLSQQPLLVAVHSGVAARSLAELVALAKSRPAPMTIGSTGSSVMLPAQAFSSAAGITLQEIPYKGVGPAMTALISGEIDILFGTIVTLYPHVRGGKVRGLAITSEKRSSYSPEMATVAELGYPGYSATVWNALVVPAGVPNEIIERLNRETVKLLSLAEVKEQFSNQGIEAVSSTPAQLSEFIRNEITRWQKVARDAGLKPE